MKNIVARIAEYNKFGSKLGLERMSLLCELIGNPQDKLRVIHVAGTNGKGSVCRYIYEVLRALGYSAGIYASPYITEFGERMEIDGEMISESELGDVAEVVFAAANRVAEMGSGDNGDEPGQPTEFEVVTAMAFLWYAKRDVDFVVLEVGLGGRGDSTNVVKAPLASVITPISLDHMDVLGDTIEKIAEEKAGIVKHGCPVICGAAGEAAKVVARVSYEMGAPLMDADKFADKVTRRARSVWDAVREAENSDARSVVLEGENNAEERNAEAEAEKNTKLVGAGFGNDAVVRNVDAVMQAVSVNIDGTRYNEIELSMAGAHQAENAAIALTAIESLRRRKLISLTADGVRAGMRRARLPGRFEVFACRPNDSPEAIPVILDGAHNASGAAALAAAVRSAIPGASITTVIGVLADKDVEAIIRQVYWFSAHMILTEPPNDRALAPSELADKRARITAEWSCGCGDPSCTMCSAEAEPQYTVLPAPSEAVNEAIARAQKDERGAVVVCGSLYLISSIRKYLLS